MKSHSRIYLIGFMGVGKTTVAKKLAKALGYQCVDTDKWMEQELGISVPKVFEKFGEEYFRIKETEILKRTSDLKDVVIATGGGLPCFYENMNWMNAHGATIYLQADPKFLHQRLSANPLKRPLIARLNEDERYQYISETLNQREAFYLQAMHHIKVPLKSVETLVNTVVEG